MTPVFRSGCLSFACGGSSAGSRGPGPAGAPPGAEPVEVRALRIAAAACQAGEGRALVTGPIHKGRLAARGFAYKGHTDFLGALCGVERPVMAFTGGSIRVALVTVHVALSAVPALLSAERIVHSGRLAAQALRDQLGIQEPRLLVCGLNPHAGDDGLMGDEEARIIAPACAQLRAEGWRAEGPLSPEGAFRLAQEGRGDLVLAMYHDQGLLPLKVLDAGRSVNWTLGLPLCAPVSITAPPTTSRVRTGPIPPRWAPHWSWRWS